MNFYRIYSVILIVIAVPATMASLVLGILGFAYVVGDSPDAPHFIAMEIAGELNEPLVASLHLIVFLFLVLWFPYCIFTWRTSFLKSELEKQITSYRTKVVDYQNATDELNKVKLKHLELIIELEELNKSPALPQTRTIKEGENSNEPN